MSERTMTTICGTCKEELVESTVVTRCIVLKLYFHIICVGMAKAGECFDCGDCYFTPGKQPRGRKSEAGTSTQPSVPPTINLQLPPPTNPDVPNRDELRSPAPSYRDANGDRDDVMLDMMVSQRLDRMETSRNQQVHDWIVNHTTISQLRPN